MAEVSKPAIRGARGQGPPDTVLKINGGGAYTELLTYLADLGLSDALLARVVSFLQANQSEGNHFTSIPNRWRTICVYAFGVNHLRHWAVRPRGRHMAAWRHIVAGKRKRVLFWCVAIRRLTTSGFVAPPPFGG